MAAATGSHEGTLQGCCYRMGQMLSSIWGEPTPTSNNPSTTEGADGTAGLGDSPPAGRDLLMRRPIPKGSMVFMQKQDPSVKSIGYRVVWVPLNIQFGPRSDHIHVKGMPTVFASDSDNNYLYSPYSNPEKFDAVNAFAVVNHVRMMYARALAQMRARLGGWQWGNGPIKVFPRAGDWANAFYSRDERALAFFHFRDPDSSDTIYTCRSFDVVAHETGHAILDALKPNYIISKNPQTGALHEAFGDLTTIFAILELLDMCEAIIGYSKGDLHSHGWFSVIGEEFGAGIGKPSGLRNADNNFKLDDVTEEVHDLSRVFTGAVFDILVDMFEVSRNLDKYDPAETLYRTGKHLVAVTILAFIKGPSTNASFRDIAESMMAVENVPEYRTIMREHFTTRKLFDFRVSPRPYTATVIPDVNTVCGTMQLYQDSPDKDQIRTRLTHLLSESDRHYPLDTEVSHTDLTAPTDVIPLVPTEEAMPELHSPVGTLANADDTAGTMEAVA